MILPKIPNTLKSIVLPSLIILLFTSCTKNEVENDLKIFSLLGNVKSFSEKSFSAVEKFGNVEKGEQEKSHSIRNFNKLGNQTSIEYYKFGALDMTYKFIYDDENHLIDESK